MILLGLLTYESLFSNLILPIDILRCWFFLMCSNCSKIKVVKRCKMLTAGCCSTLMFAAQHSKPWILMLSGHFFCFKVHCCCCFSHWLTSLMCPPPLIACDGHVGGWRMMSESCITYCVIKYLDGQQQGASGHVQASFYQMLIVKM